MDYIYESNNIKDEKSKITYIKNNIIPYLKAINSPLERNRNINILSNNTGLSSEIIIEEIKNYKSIFEGVNNSKESIHIDPKIKNKEDILLEISVIREEIGDVIITDKLEQDVNIDNLVLLEINNNIVNIPEDLRNAKSIEINKSIIEKYDYYRDILNKYIRLYYEDKRKSLQELLISEIDQSKQEEIILEINNIDKIMKK
ncbi:MAG: hypothetical protein QM532_03140 [Cyanobium sp. MAG06]|nr:hypothetical protein [Cyanobium sp. MAG06]